MIKERLKRNPVIVAIYEAICDKLHKVFNTHASYGNKNKDKVFVVVSGDGYFYEGIHGLIRHMLPSIEYAIRKGYIPVMDLRNPPPLWQDDEEKRGIENAWEYYFEQPVKGYELEEVYQSKHVITRVNRSKFRYFPEHASLSTMDPVGLQYWHRFILSYIRLNDKLSERLIIEQKKLFGQSDKILGVSIRAAFRYGNLLEEKGIYEGLPFCPSCKELIDIVERKMDEWGEYTRIFLACDDRGYVNYFGRHFGDKCCCLERKLRRFFEDDAETIVDESGRSAECGDSTLRQRNEEYLIETYLLSQCDGLISTASNGEAAFAYLLNGGKYDHLEYWVEDVGK